MITKYILSCALQYKRGTIFPRRIIVKDSM